jgi:hypothetical protein
VLNPDNPKHCQACLEFAGGYDTWSAMLGRTGGAEPGHFPGCARPWELAGGSRFLACWDACQCWIEVKLRDEWKRIEL